MAAIELYPCFGFELLGMCNYTPHAPMPSYFTMGDAVAALALTLAVQQFLKPIYQFRLHVLGVRFHYVVLAVFACFACITTATIVPHVPFLRGTPFGYPVNWEILGGLIIGAAYALVAWISLRPATASSRNIENFTGAAGMLLSEATEEDKSSFARDFLRKENLEALADLSAEFERAEQHAMFVALEELRLQGRENEGVRGRPPVSPFYIFSRRRELAKARHAWHVLQFVSESDFCRIVVTRHSWRFLRALLPLIEKHRRTESFNAFVKGIAWQALLQEDGMLAREVGYEGFGVVRNFAREFFGNPQIQTFRPLSCVGSAGIDLLDKGFIARLNLASKLMVEAQLNGFGFWRNDAVNDVYFLYENIFLEVQSARARNESIDSIFIITSGIKDLSKTISDSLNNADPQAYNALFSSDEDQFLDNAVSSIAQIVSEALLCISNDFQGHRDRCWLSAHDIIRSVFGRHGESSMGLSPFQQAVAIKLIEKLNQNMSGWYPALTRVLLTWAGPHKSNIEEPSGTASKILKDAIYQELTLLPKLYEREPQKINDYLPPNVTYDSTTCSLTYEYRDGKRVKTHLNELKLQKVDLLADENLRRR